MLVIMGGRRKQEKVVLSDVKLNRRIAPKRLVVSTVRAPCYILGECWVLMEERNAGLNDRILLGHWLEPRIPLIRRVVSTGSSHSRNLNTGHFFRDRTMNGAVKIDTKGQ